MTVVNTTFVLNMPRSEHDNFMNWLKEVYVRSALATGIFSSPLLTRVGKHSPDAADALALHLHAESEAEARRWHEETVGLLHADMQRRWPGESILPFTTYLEVIPL